jgi:hypothetical protein
MQKKVNIPRIQITAPLVLPMTQYAQHPGMGGGLLEVSGWTPGQVGERTFHMRRESGPPEPVFYRVSWTGNDGTFKAPPKVRLPLNEEAILPVKIDVQSPGAHSAILNLHDPTTDAIIVRTMATIVAPESLASASNHVLKFQGSVPLMRSREYYISVPAGTAALKVELDITQGSLSPAIRSMDPSQSVPNRSVNTFRSAKKTGKYIWAIPQPSPGTWNFTLTNDSGWREKDFNLVSTEEAKYSLSVSTLEGSAEAGDDGSQVSLHFKNRGARLIEPVADVYPGAMTTKRAELLDSGEPNLFEIEAPKDTGILQFRVAADKGATDLEAFLYDCTSGECFFSDYAGTASRQQIVTVRHPKAGKWVLAVNAAPSMAGHGGFLVEELIASKAVRQTLVSDPKHPADDSWVTSVEKPLSKQQEGNQVSVLLCELVDAALERAEAELLAAAPATPGETEEKAAPKPVAVASNIYQLK